MEIIYAIDDAPQRKSALAPSHQLASCDRRRLSRLWCFIIVRRESSGFARESVGSQPRTKVSSSLVTHREKCATSRGHEVEKDAQITAG